MTDTAASCDTLPKDISRLSWWRPCVVEATWETQARSPALRGFMARLLASFEDQGHHVVEGPPPAPTDLWLMACHVPDGPGPLRERVPHHVPPPSVTLCRGLVEASPRRRSGHVVAVVEICERLSTMTHREAVDAARVTMGRLGAFKVLFLSRGDRPGQILEATLCTPEGGHPTETANIADRIRDRLVASVCARGIAEGYDIVENAISAADWQAGTTARALVEAGRRMAGLGLLPPPHAFDDFVLPQIGEMYRAYFGWKGFSEGMLFAYDPGLDAILVTASGNWGVDKRALRTDQVVALDRRLRDGRLQVLAVQGSEPLGPSVEAWEVRAMLEAAPTVGPDRVPLIRAGIHAHVGVEWADEAVIETVAPNRSQYPYGVGCGADLTVELAGDVVRRSRAVNDPDDPRRFARWPLLYHGEMAVELAKPGICAQPLDGLLDLFGDAIRHTPDHIDQPV